MSLTTERYAMSDYPISFSSEEKYLKDVFNITYFYYKTTLCFCPNFDDEPKPLNDKKPSIKDGFLMVPTERLELPTH